MTPRELTSDESSAFLQRNIDARNRVLAFNALLAVFTYSQIQLGSVWDSELGIYVTSPIPADGARFSDSLLGSVTVWPDASGALHFLTNTPATIGTTLNPIGLPSLPSFGDIGPLLFGGVLIAGLLYFTARKVTSRI